MEISSWATLATALGVGNVVQGVITFRATREGSRDTAQTAIMGQLLGSVGDITKTLEQNEKLINSNAQLMIQVADLRRDMDDLKRQQAGWERKQVEMTERCDGLERDNARLSGQVELLTGQLRESEGRRDLAEIAASNAARAQEFAEGALAEARSRLPEGPTHERPQHEPT